LNWATSRSKRCTFSAQVREAYAIADHLRRAGVRVAMGGLHVSVRPEEAAAPAAGPPTGSMTRRRSAP